MSFDRQIDQVCPHLIAEEPLFFLGDNRSLLPLRPISSMDSVNVRINGEIVAPATGVRVPASVVGSKKAPFKVAAGSDSLSVSVHGGPVQTATLPHSTHLTAEQAADALNGQIPGLTFSAKKNCLSVETILDGEDASLYVLTATTIGAVFGITTNREYRGKTILPSWSLIQQPGTLSDRPTRLIIFDTPLKGFQDYAEVSYATVRQECRRCGGIGVESDWRYGNDGNVVEVRDEALLIQEVQKVTFTARGSNPFHTWYGSTIVEQIGSKIGASGVLQNIILSDVQSTFTRWQSIKSQQEKSGQFVSDEEFPARILNLQLQQSNVDPTVFFINVTIQNRSLNPIQLSRGIKLPQPLNLLTDSTAQGVYRQSLSNYSLVQ